MMVAASLFLLLIGLLLGMLLMSIFVKNNRNTRSSYSLSRNYLRGLNFILNEQPDKAVDIFIKLFEVDNDTIETHLALGNLFRRRGEVNRAIRIHQNLIARPNLTTEDHSEALLALATDYLSAGVLDRAENLFNKLIELKSHVKASLYYLLDIYQQEKSWKQAIDIAKRLAAEMGQNMEIRIAHYYCELAEVDIKDDNINQARQYLNQALSVDKKCIRANLLLGQLEYIFGRYKSAIRIYNKMIEQNPDFLSETIIPLIEAYQALGDKKALEKCIHNIILVHAKVPVVLFLVEKIRNWRKDEAIRKLLVDYVNKYPSILGLHHLINLKISTIKDTNTIAELSSLYQLTEKIQVNHFYYQCEGCGFSSKVMHWLCPSCKSWSTVKLSYLVEKKIKST